MLYPTHHFESPLPILLYKKTPQSFKFSDLSEMKKKMTERYRTMLQLYCNLRKKVQMLENKMEINNYILLTQCFGLMA